MSTPLIVALGAFAGLTVFLGLPFARLKNLPNSMQAFLNACATGILIAEVGFKSGRACAK
jgi:ZIP family zinc transporter